MPLSATRVCREVIEGNGPEGRFCQGNVLPLLAELKEQYGGAVKLIYLDPPFRTGDRFEMRVRVGKKEWKSGRGTLALEAYRDPKDLSTYLNMMRRVLMACRELLREDGMLFLHADYRASAHLRLLLDELFGEENFLNEIIWAYQSGGRARSFFSRKHDSILFYRKTKAHDFNIDAVMAPRETPRSSHMRRHVDPDGRVYRSIRTNGKVYTYYDDAPVAPSDVWQDLSHLQQKDPERTGYDTQKPLALLDRIVRCASRPGDIVLDPFAGSCTTLEAALRTGRPCIGIDRCPMTANIARRRLTRGSLRIENRLPESGEAPICGASVNPGVGFYHVTLDRFEGRVAGMREDAGPFDAVDNWSVGYLRETGYEVMSSFARSRREPELRTELTAPVYAGPLALGVGDVAGRTWYYRLETAR